MPAVTLSGFNNIDFNAILEAVMVQERLPVSRLETQKRALEQQNTQLGQLAGYLTTLKSAADDLANPTSLAVLAATSSDEKLVGVTAAAGTTPGTYDVVVSARAKAQVTASSTTSGATDIVATGGTLQLLVGADPPVSILVTGNMTLEQLAQAINSTEDAPVTASVVQVTPGSYRLVLTGRQTGVDNAFSLVNTLAGGTGVLFADPNAVEAIDASLTVNNVAVTSASNTLTSVIPGATLTIEGEDSGETVHVTVARDGERIKGKVEGFVQAYNKLVDFVTAQRAAALEGKPSVATNPMVRSLHTQLRATVLGEHGVGSITRLAGAGVGFDRSGHMTIDDETFDELIASDPEAVQELFAGSAGADGAFDALEAVVETFTRPDGLVRSARTRLTEQVDTVTSRIDHLEAQLLIRRDALHREFIAADQAMQRLQSQIGSLSALGGQYRLF